MDSKIKALAEAITHTHTKKLVQTHLKDLAFDETAQHLVMHVDNAGPLHELESKEGDHHLNAGLEKIYGDQITYELKLHKGTTHEREKAIPHSIKR